LLGVAVIIDPKTLHGVSAPNQGQRIRQPHNRGGRKREEGVPCGPFCITGEPFSGFDGHFQEEEE